MRLYFKIFKRSESVQGVGQKLYSAEGAISMFPDTNFVGPVEMLLRDRDEFDLMTPDTTVEFRAYDSYDPAVHVEGGLTIGAWADSERPPMELKKRD